MRKKPAISDDSAELRRRAEARLREQPSVTEADFSAQRLLHELEVHRIELEMQNAELQKTRDELEVALEKFTDLYDFAPVGYFSIDESGLILEANLKSAALLGVERSRLINRSLLLFVDQKSRPVLMAFLKNVFAEAKDQECEALLLKGEEIPFWPFFGPPLQSALLGRGDGAESPSATLPRARKRKRRNAAWRTWPRRTWG